MRKLIIAVVVLCSFVRCKKEATSNNTNQNGFSKKVSLNTSRFLLTTSDTPYTGMYEESISVIATDCSNRLDIGDVKYADSVFTKLISGTNTFYNSQYENPNLMSGWSSFLDGGKTWTVTGNAATGIPPFTSTSSPIYPSILNTTFRSKIAIDRNNPFTVSWDASVPADSVDVWIGSSQTGVAKSGVLPGSTSSYTFTPTQLQTVPQGNSVLLQIAAWIDHSQVVSNVQFNVHNGANTRTYVEVR